MRRQALKLAMLVVLLTAGVVAASYAGANDGTDSGLGAAATAEVADPDSTSTDAESEPAATTTEAAPPTEPPADTQPAETTAPAATTTAPPEPTPTPTAGGETGSKGSPQSPEARHHQGAKPLELESEHAIVWLHRVLPDPTPPAKRLSPAFAGRLRAVAAEKRVHWWLFLGVLRASGHENHSPATRARLVRLATELAERGVRHHPWRAIARLRSAGFASQAMALARYDRAIGLRSLVRGLESQKARLAHKVLRDRRIEVYGPGRLDIASGRVDVRVLVLIRYLAVTFHQVSVSSLVAGHRLFARPGVVSAHVDGLAVDISGLARTPIYGHQQPGGITERAVTKILLLPVEVQPQQVISLLGLGGPSFPLADHYDHIHVGF